MSDVSKSDWPHTGGLYMVWLSPTHYYIGRAANFRVRWLRHLRDLQQGRHSNPYMQSLFRVHHIFRPEIVVEEALDENRVALEQRWLDTHYGRDGCANTSRSARGVMQGRKHSDDSRAKMRGKHPSEDTRRRLSEAHRGVKRPDVAHRNVARTGLVRRPDVAHRNVARTGWRHTLEAISEIAEAGRREMPANVRDKISSAHKKRGTKPPGFKGKRHSPETIRKLSDAAKGRRLSEEGRAKRSEAIRASWVKRKAAKERVS